MSTPASVLLTVVLAFFLGFSAMTHDALARAKAAPRVTVATPLGAVVGLEGAKTSSFKGIPYALPTAGGQRFKPPVPVGPWDGPLEAFNFGNACPQVRSPLVDLGPDTPGQGEDCLSLNVWTPKGAKPGDDLPVYFFIHGGGFGVGAGSQPVFDGAALASEGIILVTVNYRLGAFGFLASRETFKESGTTGNWGILDQIAALEWVRDNISSFGGDPKKVTIGGESAGSISVSVLIASPRAADLFRGAVMESGTIFSYRQTAGARGRLDQAQRAGALMGSVVGGGDTPEGLANLRRLEADELALVSSFNLDMRRVNVLGPVPVSDGVVLPEDNQRALAAAPGSRVNVLVGFNADEGSIFVFDDGSPPEVYKTGILSVLGLPAADAFNKRFPVDQNHTHVQRAREAAAYGLFTSAAKRFADVYSRWGKVWMYRFDYVSDFGRRAGIGAYHSSELEYVFGNQPVKTRPEQRVLGEELRARWVSFIKTGDPNNGNPPGKLNWPVYNPADPRVIRFDKTVVVTPLPEAEDLEFMARQLHGPVPGPPRTGLATGE
ncbi:MAG: carboxylesterase family protein [Deltaproteobacteria bacterium]|jgi:para-nitrobenzyl esterase|nr:carboxylesterase family protein [Deltaproteobacteria bacterium]